MRNPIRHWLVAIAALFLAPLLFAAQTTQPFHRAGPFLLGADISWVQEDEADGATYFDHGKQEDPFKILKDHGFNAIRLRVFVDPASPKGYAVTSKEAFCDMAHTLVMAKRAHDAGMNLLIDFHYSDTWADPGKQAKPAAWEKLDFPALKKAVYDHTHKVLEALKDQGTTPQMVQIGNEVSNGMLWPDGHAPDHFDQFAELLRSGITAARDVDPSIKIVLHTDKGSNDALARRWVENLVTRGVQPDIIGLSCNGKNPPEKWKETFDDLAKRYPQFGLIASEYGYHKRELNDIVYNAPDHRGIGTFIWEPTRHHEALFDQEGHNAGTGTQKHPTTGDVPFTATPGHHPRTGRFDTNDLINLYDKMSKDFDNQYPDHSPATTQSSFRQEEFTSPVDHTRQTYLITEWNNAAATERPLLVVYLHGSGSHQDQGTKQGIYFDVFGRMQRWMAAKGRAVYICPEYRGNSWMGPTAEADVVEIIRLARARYHLTTVLLTGGSMGGTSALIFASRHPDLLDGVLVWCPATDPVAMYARFPDQFRAGYGGSPAEASAEYSARTSRNHADELAKLPIVIVHGSADSVIPVEHSRILVQRLTALNAPVRYVELPGVDHDGPFQVDVASLLDWLLAQQAPGKK